MNRYRFGLTTCWFWLLIVIIVFLIEGANFLAIDPTSKFSVGDLVAISLLVVFVALVYYIVEKKFNKARVSWSMLPIVLILLATGLIGIWFSSDSYTINGVSFTYSAQLLDKVTWTIQLVLGLFFIYLAFGIFSKRIVRVKSLRPILWILVLACFFCIFYSYVVEVDAYKAIFAGDSENIVSIKSLFNNENNYGQLLLLTLGCLILLNAIKFRWWHFIFIIFIFINVIFSTSFTAILIMVLLIHLYIFYLYFRSLTKHPYRNTITLVIYITVLVLGFCTIAYVNITSIEYIKNLVAFINDKILSKDFTTLSGRSAVWIDALSLLQTPLDFIVGKGYGNFNSLYNAYVSTSKGVISRYSVESAYVEVLGSFGIVGLFIYITAIFLLISIAIYCLAKKRIKIVLPCFMMLICFLIYSAFETVIMFKPDTSGVYTFVIIALPILIEFNHVRKQNQLELSLMKNSEPNKEVVPFSNKMVVQLTSTILAACLFINLLLFALLDEYLNLILIAFVINLLLFLFYPYMLAIWHKSYNRHLVVFRSTILTLILLLTPFALVIPITLFMSDINLTLLMAFYLIGFAFILTIELIFTISIGSNARQMIRLMFNYGIKPHFLWMIILLAIFAPLCVYFNYVMNISYFVIFCLSILLFFVYIFGLYIIPNVSNCKKNHQIIINQVNNRYILRQKMLYILNRVDD